MLIFLAYEIYSHQFSLFLLCLVSWRQVILTLFPSLYLFIFFSLLYLPTLDLPFKAFMFHNSIWFTNFYQPRVRKQERFWNRFVDFVLQFHLLIYLKSVEVLLPLPPSFFLLRPFVSSPSLPLLLNWGPREASWLLLSFKEIIKDKYYPLKLYLESGVVLIQFRVPE